MTLCRTLGMNANIIRCRFGTLSAIKTPMRFILAVLLFASPAMGNSCGSEYLSSPLSQLIKLEVSREVFHVLYYTFPETTEAWLKIGKVEKFAAEFLKYPELVFYSKEFGEFFSDRPTPATFEEAVSQFMNHMGYVTVYRGMALTDDEAKSLKNFRSKTPLAEVAKAGYRLAGLFESHVRYNGNVGNDKVVDPFISVSFERDLAASVGESFAAKNGKKVFVAEMRLPKVKVLSPANSKYLSFLLDAIFILDNGKSYRLNSGTESVVLDEIPSIVRLSYEPHPPKHEDTIDILE